MLAINCFETASDCLEFAPSHVIEHGGVRIGIIGIASNIFASSMPPSYATGLRLTLRGALCRQAIFDYGSLRSSATRIRANSCSIARITICTFCK